MLCFKFNNCELQMRAMAQTSLAKYNVFLGLAGYCQITWQSIEMKS